MTKEKKGFDIESLDTVTACEEGADLEIVHPRTGEPLGIIISVVGADSPTYRSELHKLANKRAKRGRGVLNSESIEADNIELLVACTRGWSGLDYKGAALAFSPANARMVYKDFVWLREQVDAFIGDRANFLKN